MERGIIDPYKGKTARFYGKPTPIPVNRRTASTGCSWISSKCKAQLRCTGPTEGGSGQGVLFTSFNVGADNVGWTPPLFINLVTGNEATPIADAVVGTCAMPGM